LAEEIADLLWAGDFFAEEVETGAFTGDAGTVGAFKTTVDLDASLDDFFETKGHYCHQSCKYGQ